MLIVLNCLSSLFPQYNYTLSAALDSGTILSAIVVFLVLGLPGASLKWIGNTIYENSEF